MICVECKPDVALVNALGAHLLSLVVIHPSLLSKLKHRLPSERAAEMAEKEGKSLGTFLWETLAMRLEGSSSKARKLKGVLADYALKGVNPEEVREKVKEEVARDAAKEEAVATTWADLKQ